MTPEYRRCDSHRIPVRDRKGNPITVPQALRDRGTGQSYICSDCNHEVFPIRGHVNPSTNLWTKGYFRTGPLSEIRKNGSKKQSRREEAIEYLVASLSQASNFDHVASEVLIQSYQEKDRQELNPKELTVDVLARRTRSGYESIDMVLHVVELPLNSIKDLYSKAREIGFESKTKYAVDGDERVKLKKEIYQNFIIIKDSYSYEAAGRNKVELVPMVHNFLGFLNSTALVGGDEALQGANIYYYDPDSQLLLKVSFSEPQQPSVEVKNNPNLIFNVELEEIDYFTFTGRDLGKVQRKVRNWHGKENKFSINFNNWKLAIPEALMIDGNGNPILINDHGQRELLL